jgi:hypothetical protein
MPLGLKSESYKWSILQLSFTSRVFLAYSTMRWQCEHIPMVVLCVDFIVGSIGVRVPYNSHTV